MQKNKILLMISLIALICLTRFSFANDDHQYAFILKNETKDAILEYKAAGGWGYARIVAYDAEIPIGARGKYTLEGYPGNGKYFQVVYTVRHLTDPEKVAECVMDFNITNEGKINLGLIYDHPTDPRKPAGTTFVLCERAGLDTIVVRNK